MSRPDKVLSPEESTPAHQRGIMSLGDGGLKGGAAAYASDAPGLAEVPENNVSTGVRTSGIGEFESVRGNTSDLSATSSEGLVRLVTDVSGTR